MLKKYLPVATMATALLLLFVATQNYPGGSQADKNSVGYSWINNYLSNLFSPQAVNGSPNTARPWAVAGMLFLCAGFSLFFYRCSKKIPSRSASLIIRYFSFASMLAAFLTVTPYHDLMVMISATSGEISIFYITVFLLKSKLSFLKILSVVLLIVFYSSQYIYYTRTHIEFLPVMQKLTLAIAITWAVCLEYFTMASDFPSFKKKN